MAATRNTLLGLAVLTAAFAAIPVDAQSARTGASDRRAQQRQQEAPPPKVDTVALVGTMQSDLGLVAIFDGSDPAFRAAVPVGGEIAGFKVKRILPAGVELSAGERNLTLRMSQQLRRIAGGDWRTTGRDLSRADFGRAEASPSAAPAQPAIPANTSDVVRRLMEQRQKQLKQ